MGVRRDAASGHLGDGVGLRDQGRGRREVTSPCVAHGQRDQTGRQLLERASVTGELDLPRDDRAPGIFVPQHGGGDPAPPESLFPGDVSRGEGVHCLPQRRNRGGGTVGDQPRQAVEEQVDRAGRVPGRGEGPGGAGDLEHIAGACQMPGERGRAPRGQVGLAGQIQVQRLEPLGRLEQQRGSVAAQARDERDLPAQQVHPARWNSSSGPASAVASSSRALPNAPACMLACAAASDAFGVPRRIGGQQHRSLQERRGRGQPAAGLRPPGRPLQLRRDLLIRPGRGLGPVPGPPVRIGLRVGHLRQRRVQLLPLGEWR